MYGEVVAHYAALLESWPQLNDGMGVTYVQGLNHDAVILAFGGHPADAMMLTVDEAIDVALAGRPSVDSVLVREAGEWIVVVEPLSGYRGESAPVLQAVASVRAVNVFWSIAGPASFSMAAAGETAFWLDLNDSSNDRLPADMAPLAEALGLWDSDWYAPALALAELLTGVRLTDEFLAGKFTTVLLPQQ
ncbi:DUF6461 domain-containing protein [Dactylosporangium sp. NPDC000521]|uniref:DUF6461 domain-containing protein n=1 Tax=Dactylosporangium sp. NPDC000521 TaxID=3363975 RepID=UPI0036811CD5